MNPNQYCSFHELYVILFINKLGQCQRQSLMGETPKTSLGYLWSMPLEQKKVRRLGRCYVSEAPLAESPKRAMFRCAT